LAGPVRGWAVSRVHELNMKSRSGPLPLGVCLPFTAALLYTHGRGAPAQAAQGSGVRRGGPAPVSERAPPRILLAEPGPHGEVVQVHVFNQVVAPRLALARKGATRREQLAALPENEVRAHVLFVRVP
jgi:hypothetical protein